MAIFTGVAKDGSEVIYKDKKRHLWLLGYVGTLMYAFTFWSYFAFGENPIVTLIPVIYIYFITALIDKVLGVDNYNTPEEVVPAMMADNYYRYQVHAHIPIFFVVLAAFTWFVATQDLPAWAVIALIIGVGSGSGAMLAITHELGHKGNKLDRFLAKAGNTLLGYGHFNIEHNRGHHVWVSTPEDPASARMGESIYRFLLRELPGTIKRGLHHEKRRLAAKGKGFWSIHNDVLQVYCVSLSLLAIAAFIFGPNILWFLIPHHMIGWYALTQANYIEHYGLMRQKLANGKYEKCQPRHSWNTNHLWSNMALFHLQRHSDHHAFPTRPYQVLRNFDDLPSLPSGYGGCFALAAIPALWFKIMDPKVMEWADGDITKVNIDPKHKEKLYKKYGADFQQAAE
ncbi:MAG: alkane 1-monooxygenase [Robiginitomaculum sp.]|nr:MAG: alkane 1-monooxygenase [Robiginitomaculum sp.]